MTTLNGAVCPPGRHVRRPSVHIRIRPAFLLCILLSVTAINAAPTRDGSTGSVASDAPYANMPSIPPIGVRIAKYMDVPDSAKGPAVDPAKGYRIQKLGDGLYMITDNA